MGGISPYTDAVSVIIVVVAVVVVCGGHVHLRDTDCNFFVV